MSQQTAKAGARQPSGKKVKEFNLQGVDGKTYLLIRLQGKESLPQILGFLVLNLSFNIRLITMI